MTKSQPRPDRSWKHSALALSIVAGAFGAIPSPAHATHLRRIAVDLPPGPDLKVTKLVASVDQALGIVIYSITVKNVGSAAAPGPIKLTDVLPSGPAGVTFIGFSGTFGSGTCASVPYSTGPVVCTQAAALPAGATLTVSIHVKVPMPAGGTVTNCASATLGQGPGTPSDVNPANNTNICAPPVVFGAPVKPDLQITKTGVVTAPGVITYTITVKNIGTAPAPGPIVMTDQLPTAPAGVTFQSFSGTFGSGPGTCTAPSSGLGPIVCTQPGPLAPGASQVVNVVVHVPATGGTVSNCAAVSGASNPTTPGDPNLANNHACSVPITIAPTGAPDLQVTKTASVGANGGITYTIIITNVGGSIAPAPITAYDTLSAFPVGTHYTGAGGNGGFSCPGAGGSTPWTCTTNSSLAAGASMTLLISVSVPMPTGGSVTNCARAKAPMGDPNLSNNRSCVTINVPGTAPAPPDLKITKTGTVGANGGITYTLTITNVGGSVAPAPIIVYDTLVTKPAGTHFTGAGGTGGFSCPGAGNAAPWTCTSNSPIGPGASVTLLISVTVPKPPGGSVLNCARVKAPTGDPDMTNNRSCVSINVP